MTFIKLTHLSGSVYLNLDQVVSIEETSTVDLTISDNTNASPTVYSFSSASDRAEVVAKLESIVRVIDIDTLAAQQ
jgi:hypothetical protein